MDKPNEGVRQKLVLRITDHAYNDLNDITDYISGCRKQPLNAGKVGISFFKAFDKISRTPTAYKECPLLKTKSKKYRQATCLSWQIIFKISGEEIVVLGLIHFSRSAQAFKDLKKLK